MSERQMLLPNESHPIHIGPARSHIMVWLNRLPVADTVRALMLKEADYPAVVYIPLEDVDTNLLVKTDHQTYCPYKGECSYYSIVAGDKTSENAVWTYESPYPAVAQIKNHVAFYPNRVDSIEEIRPGIEELPGLR